MLSQTCIMKCIHIRSIPDEAADVAATGWFWDWSSPAEDVDVDGCCSASAGCGKITVDKDGGIHSCADARMTLYAKTTSSSSSTQTVTGSSSERFNFCFPTNPFHAPQYQLSVIDISVMVQQMQYRTFWGRFNTYMTKTCIRTLQKTLVFQLASAC